MVAMHSKLVAYLGEQLTCKIVRVGTKVTTEGAFEADARRTGRVVGRSPAQPDELPVQLAHLAPQHK